jgi:regulator of replication initiation timing
VHCPECEHLRAELAEARGDIKALRTERTELYLEQERLREKLAHSRLDELKEKFYAARAGGE